MLLINKKTIAI